MFTLVASQTGSEQKQCSNGSRGEKNPSIWHTGIVTGHTSCTSVVAITSNLKAVDHATRSQESKILLKETFNFRALDAKKI